MHAQLSGQVHIHMRHAQAKKCPDILITMNPSSNNSL